MFARLIRRDLAALNAVHSGQFVSNFLYDATLMRDALTQGVAAIFLEAVQLVVYAGRDALSATGSLASLSLLALPLRRLGDGAAGRLDAPRRHPRHAARPAICPSCCPKRWTGGASSRPMAWKRTASERVACAAVAARLQDPAEGGAAARRRGARRPTSSSALVIAAGAVRAPASRSCTASSRSTPLPASSPRCCWRSSRCATSASSGPPPRPASPRPTASSPSSMRSPRIVDRPGASR